LAFSKWLNKQNVDFLSDEPFFFMYDKKYGYERTHSSLSHIAKRIHLGLTYLSDEPERKVVKETQETKR
jgi:hypothetical protein